MKPSSPPAPWSADLLLSARQALACLDLTSLNDADSEADIAKLCQRAQSKYGQVAAVCVWPRLAAFARGQLPPSIQVAAVANFPQGGADIELAVRDAANIVQSGAQEVDVVLPYVRLMEGDTRHVTKLLAAVRKACEPLRLKVILETGVLQTPALIELASRISLDQGADFLKTSTGKVSGVATPEAARTMLNCIAADSHAATRVGFKPSGGIRTVADAALYLDLTQEILGQAALTPQRFRIGASGILSDIEALLGGAGAAPGTAPSAGSGY